MLLKDREGNVSLSPQDLVARRINMDSIRAGVPGATVDDDVFIDVKKHIRVDADGNQYPGAISKNYIELATGRNVISLDSSIFDSALTQEDVIVERYGEPRVAILSYQRYQQLLQAERTLSSPYLVPPDRSPEAQQKGKLLAEQVRQDLQTELDGSLEEVMSTLRGREWS